MEFRVKNLPPPLPYLGRKNSTDSRIDKSELLAQSRLRAKLPDTDFNVQYEIVSAEIQGKARGGDVLDFALTNGVLSTAAKDYIRRMPNKAMLSIAKVKARVVGTRAPIYDIPGLNLKVIRN